MSIHTKNKILVSIIVFLLITNIFMLVSFIDSKKTDDQPPKSQNRFSLSDRLKSDVGFDDTQVAKYEDLRKVHKEKMKPLFQEMTNLKEDFYKLLEKPEVSDSELNASANQIAEKQKEIDLQLYQHFKSLKEVCTPDQLAKFDTLTQNVIKRIISPRRGGGPKPDSSKADK